MGCRTCLISRSGDKIGDKCRTEGCPGIIEVELTRQDVQDKLPEPFTCPRRVEQGHHVDGGPFAFSGSNLDRWWKFKTNGQRTCGYCGSLHPDDFFTLVKASGEAPKDAPYRTGIEIEVTDKRYKIYIHQPGVRNASEGGIKFYTQHLPIRTTPEQEAEFRTAAMNSHERFNTMVRRKPEAP